MLYETNFGFMRVTGVALTSAVSLYIYSSTAIIFQSSWLVVECVFLKGRLIENVLYITGKNIKCREEPLFQGIMVIIQIKNYSIICASRIIEYNLYEGNNYQSRLWVEHCIHTQKYIFNKKNNKISRVGIQRSTDKGSTCLCIRNCLLAKPM